MYKNHNIISINIFSIESIHRIECGKYYHNLEDSSHTASLSMEPKVLPESNEVESEKRKRGRPKGSKNKVFGHTNNVSNYVSKDFHYFKR